MLGTHPKGGHSASLRDREKIAFRCARTPPSIFHQSSPNLEEYIPAIRGGGGGGGDLRWLVPSTRNSFKRNGLT